MPSPGTAPHPLLFDGWLGCGRPAWAPDPTHKDLDLLVALFDLPRLWQVLDEHGFTLQYVWEEHRWVERESGRWPTAFVAADEAGRALDLHVIDFGPDGTLLQLYNKPWPFPETITAQGRIVDIEVPCISKETQLAMHVGYPVPEEQLQDLRHLQVL